MASIRLDGIYKNFQKVEALVNIVQTVETGQFFTLLGPSGCGKTTLLRTIAGFYKQDSGHLFFSDQMIDDVPAQNRDTGMVFQNYAVFPHMTVFENVAFGLKTRKVNPAEIKNKVANALDKVHLTGFENRTPDQLSGGQQQRVGLARAMVIEPKVLLMDEPLSNLDAKLRINMRDEIRNMQRELGITTIYVTHDQEEALAISDRIAVMDQGVIQQVGTPWEIYKNPINTFVASFVGDMNFMDGEVIESQKGSQRILVKEHELRTNKPGISTGKIRLAVRPENISIASAEENDADCLCIRGRINSSLFIGSLIRYTVDCGNGLELISERHRPQSEELMQSSTPVFAKIPIDSVLYYDSQEGTQL